MDSKITYGPGMVFCGGDGRWKFTFIITLHDRWNKVGIPFPATFTSASEAKKVMRATVGLLNDLAKIGESND